LQSNLLMDAHVTRVLGECAGVLYAINTLKAHGMQVPALQEVFRGKILSKLTYASPAWSGLASSENFKRINSFLKRAKRMDFFRVDGLSFENMCSDADETLFKNIVNNPSHVLHRLLPPIKNVPYNLRTRKHNFTLSLKDDRNFINRMIFKNIF